MGTWTPMLTGDALAIGNPLPDIRFSCISYSLAFLIMASSQNWKSGKIFKLFKTCLFQCKIINLSVFSLVRRQFHPGVSLITLVSGLSLGISTCHSLCLGLWYSCLCRWPALSFTHCMKAYGVQVSKASSAAFGTASQKPQSQSLIFVGSCHPYQRLVPQTWGVLLGNQEKEVCVQS